MDSEHLPWGLRAIILPIRLPSVYPMNQARPKLRVGLVLDGDHAPAWVACVFERIVASEHSQLALLVVDRSPVSAGAAAVARTGWTGSQQRWRIFRRVLEAFDQRWLEAPSGLPSAVDRVDIAKHFCGVPCMELSALQGRHADRVGEDEVAALRTHGLDVLLLADFRSVRGEMLTVARYGIWSLYPGDTQRNRGGPPGFWEVMENWPQIGSTLLALREDPDNSVVLGHSWSAVNAESLAETRDGICWNSLSLILRQLQLLHRKGAERFFADARACEPHPQFYSRRPYRAASNREFAALVARRFWRKLKKRARHEFWFDQWILLFHVNDAFSPALWRYRRVLPPKDRFWADPFVLQRGDRYFVFIEELPYASQKGHIAVIEVDASGRPGPAVPVLVADHHLSYPFVFEHDGQTYMIPESRAANCISLYRCVDFPLRWEKVMNLMDNVAAVDTTLHYRDGRWWLFANMIENRGESSWNELYLFHATTFTTTQWTPHPLNPVVSDVRRARPAGRLFELNGHLYRPSQDCSHCYGWGLNLNVVERWDEQTYSERVVTRAEPAWASDVLATHTYNAAGRLHVLDAQIRRRR